MSTGAATVNEAYGGLRGAFNQSLAFSQDIAAFRGTKRRDKEKGLGLDQRSSPWP